MALHDHTVYHCAAQKLLTTIQSFPGEMATTPEGKAWVIKALHPSDPLTVVRGLPDESSSSTVVLQYHNVFRLSAPSTQTSGTWGFDLTAIPDMIAQACWRRYDSDGIPNGVGNFLNAGLTPPGVGAPSYVQLLAQFNTMGVEAHRLLAYGITAYQDGPALADQGTLTACQYEVSRRKFYVNSSEPVLTTDPLAHMRIACYQETDLGSYETSQMLPTSYFGESKQGCYLPLRLTRTSQNWTTPACLEKFLPIGTTSVGGVGDDLRIGHAPPPAGMPYPALGGAWVVDSSGGIAGDRVYHPLNGIWGAICARNLSYQTSFAFYFRVLVEVRVQPGSLLCSQQQMSPPYDPVALASYFRISRELKDAYPADFNDLGKIWDVIKKAASFVLPAISAVPGPVGMLGKAGTAAMAVGNALSGISRSGGRSRGKRQETTAGPAEIERAKAAIAQRVSAFTGSGRKRGRQPNRTPSKERSKSRPKGNK